MYAAAALEQYGTVDAVILQDNELQVHDLKYGRGEQVNAESNKQLMMFGTKDKSGARKQRHHTKKGPGRMPYNKGNPVKKKEKR
jgi:hypothetical protein